MRRGCRSAALRTNLSASWLAFPKGCGTEGRKQGGGGAQLPRQHGSTSRAGRLAAPKRLHPQAGAQRRSHSSRSSSSTASRPAPTPPPAGRNWAEADAG